MTIKVPPPLPMFRYPQQRFEATPADELAPLVLELVRDTVQQRHDEASRQHDELMRERERKARDLAEVDDRIDAVRHEIHRTGVWLSENQPSE